ncbi:MAG: hypothetical protein IJT36_10000 [Alphaproteobacteria bacterium]|nr:hypothetical protein [Alphaproteobacteria bacterium]
MNKYLVDINFLLHDAYFVHTVNGYYQSSGQEKDRDIPRAKELLEYLHNRHYMSFKITRISQTRPPEGEDILSPYAEVAFPLVDAYVEKRLASDGAHGTTAATPVTHNEDDE